MARIKCFCGEEFEGTLAEVNKAFRQHLDEVEMEHGEEEMEG